MKRKRWCGKFMLFQLRGTCVVNKVRSTHNIRVTCSIVQRTCAKFPSHNVLNLSSPIVGSTHLSIWPYLCVYSYYIFCLEIDFETRPIPQQVGGQVLSGGCKRTFSAVEFRTAQVRCCLCDSNSWNLKLVFIRTYTWSFSLTVTKKGEQTKHDS